MFRVIFAVLLFLAVLVACQGHQGSRHDPALSSKMRDLYSEFVQIMPYIYNRESFRRYKNRDTIKVRLREFKKSIHSIDSALIKKNGRDPLLTATADEFERDVEIAIEAFNNGHLDFSRSKLTSAISYCFRCHTSSNIGARFTHIDFPINNLSAVERADVYIATRQYDRAIKTLEKVIDNPGLQKGVNLELKEAVYKHLAILVRIKRSPQSALEKINSVLTHSASQLPNYFTEDARQWEKALRHWVSTGVSDPQPRLKQARQLFQKAAQVKVSHYDRAGDVEYLRATTLLHEYLLESPPKKKQAEAFYLLGTAYEILRELTDTNLPITYFEACIRIHPHSDRAKKCYRKYEENIYSKYSWQSPSYVPSMLNTKLGVLRSLAQ